MAGHELIDDYLADVAHRLRWRPDADAVIDELRDHLYCAVERRAAAGNSATEAQHETLAAFGPPGNVAMDFASSGTSGLAVPTSFTVTAGRLAPLAAIGWVLVSVLFTASHFADQVSGNWEGTPQVLWMTGAGIMIMSAALSAAVVIALVERHGGLGVVGHAGIGLTSLGALATLIGWFYPGWGGLIGVGCLIIAVAMWRRSILPRRPTIAFGGSWLLAGAIGVALRVMEVGTPDQFGDYQVALLVGLAVGCAGFAFALFGFGRWLAREDPIGHDEIRAMATAERVDQLS